MNTKRRLDSVAIETEQDLELWGSWVRSGNGTGLGYPRTSPMFRTYQPRYPRESFERIDEGLAESIDAAVRSLPLVERRAISYMFVEGVPSWQALAAVVCRDPQLPAITRHTARELVERGAARVETWLQKIAA